MATGTYAPDPDLHVVDANGLPVNGGLVWTYIAGTTTPIATYTDVGLTVPNSNPIVAGSDGRFVAFLTPGQSYKFVYETAATPPAHGSVLATRDNILAVAGLSNPTSDNRICELRLTLSVGVPITTADVTAATSVFIEPYAGNRIALWDGINWNIRTVVASSISLTGFTLNTLFDVFAADSGGSPTYSTTPWTNDTTRSVALALQDGVYVKSGAPTLRYLGTFRTTGTTGQCEDSQTKRYLWNYYNRVPRRLRIVEATNSWTYTTATLRQANANAANQVDVVIGVQEAVPVSLQISAIASNSTGGVSVGVAIGLDSTTLNDAINGLGGAIAAATVLTAVHCRYEAFPTAGRHFYAWLEESAATGTTTWYSNGGGAMLPTNTVSGLSGSVYG